MAKIFIEIRAKGGETLNPFLLSKLIEARIGKISNAKRNKDSIILEANEDAISKINGQKINNIEIEAKRHEYLNKSKGTIYSPSLNYVETKEIEQELERHGVTRVTRFLKKGKPTHGEKGIDNDRGIELTNTGVYLLEFGTPNRPNYIEICFERIQVRTYYPNPRPCNNCGELNHHQNNCRNHKRCLKCGEIHYDDHQCTVEPRCINCKANHTTFNRTCPEIQKEKTIIKYAIDNQISRAMARRRVQISPATTYATATKINNEKDAEIENLKKQLHQLQSLNQTLLKRINNLTMLTTSDDEMETETGKPTADSNRLNRKAIRVERNPSSEEQSPSKNSKPKKQKKTINQ